MSKNNKVLTTKKYGITLVTLIITIVVAIILATAGIATVSNSISDATVTAFADDLNTIEDQVNLYYLQNNSFPTASEDESALSLGEVLDIVSNDSEFKNELNLNGESNINNELGAFYKIDISKINLDKTVRGNASKGNDDIYVVSASNMRVYYLKGVEVKGTTYYSLSSKIIKYAKKEVSNSQDNIESDVQNVGSLSVKKIKKTWTNKFGITLNAYINSGETLIFEMAGWTFNFNTNIGNNIFVFNTLDELKQKLDNSDSYFEQDFNDFISDVSSTSWDSLEDKNMKIIRNSGSNIIDELKIDLSNFDITPPNTLNNFSLTESDQENIAKFTVSDGLSGVKEVRYDYLNKYNENGIVENYYTGVSELEGSYLKARGKKASVSKDGNVEIKLPKDIEGIEILILDKADNWTLVTKSVATNFYIGTTLSTINNAGAGFKVAFNNANGIYDYTIQVSTNGTSYSSAITKTPNTTNITYSEFINEYKEGININDYLYIKVTARDNSSSKTSKIRIFKYSINDGKSSYVGDSVADMVSGVPIPKGFVASKATGENIKANGLVIYEGTTPVTDSNVTTARTTRNQFVWIPVEDMRTFRREIPTYNTTTNSIEWNAPAGSIAENTTTPEYIEMLNSITKYGGFYIARYEAGIPNTNARLESKEQSLQLCSQGVKPVSIKEAHPWNYIPWGTTNNTTTNSELANSDPIDGAAGDQTADGAVKVSRSLYPNVERLSQYKLNTNLTNNTGVISTLCYGICRDSVIKFVSDVINPETNTPYITDSTNMGWYKNNYTSNTRLKTGMDITDSLNKVKNIYDLGGNLNEWTMEGRNINSASTYTRGLCGGNYNGTYPASFRQDVAPYTSGYNIGFRIMLYIR